MSRTLEYTFPAANEQDVCLVQSTNGGGDELILNGLLASPTGKSVSFLAHGYSRSLSLTSLNDLSAVQFFINGTQNGVEIEEVIFGPNGNTVYTLKNFDEITRIFVGPAVQDVSIGTGTNGFFPLIGINLERPLIDYALTFSTSNLIGMETSIYATLDDIYKNNKSFQSNINTNKNLFELKASSAQENYILPPEDIRIYKSLLVGIVGDEFDIDTEIQIKFIQI